jgi:hypothetical protein
MKGFQPLLVYIKPVLVLSAGVIGVCLNPEGSFRFSFSIAVLSQGLTWLWFEHRYFPFLALVRFINRHKAMPKPPSDDPKDH